MRSAERYKILVHTEIGVDKDFCLEVGNTLNRLVPYSVDAKRGGQKTFLKKGKLVMIWRIGHLNLLLKNEKNRDVDPPTEQRLECNEETSQQYLDIGGHIGLEKWI